MPTRPPLSASESPAAAHAPVATGRDALATDARVTRAGACYCPCDEWVWREDECVCGEQDTCSGCVAHAACSWCSAAATCYAGGKHKAPTSSCPTWVDLQCPPVWPHEQRKPCMPSPAARNGNLWDLSLLQVLLPQPDPDC